MSYVQNLVIGDKVTLSRVTKEDHFGNGLRENVINFPSKLVDIISDEIIVVTVPVVNNVDCKMYKDQEYKISIFTKTNILQTHVLVVKVYKEDNLSLVRLHLQGELKKFQRRKFYRMPCTIPLVYREVSPLEQVLINRLADSEVDTRRIEEDIGSKSYNAEKEKIIHAREICQEILAKLQEYQFSGVINDLSGGGIRFHSEKRNNLFDKFRVKFNIYEEFSDEELELDISIVDCSKVSNRPLLFEYRASFTSITEQQREKIIRDIFKIESENRRRKNFHIES